MDGLASSPPRGVVAPQGLHVASWDRDWDCLSLFTSSAVFCVGPDPPKPERCMVKCAAPTQAEPIALAVFCSRPWGPRLIHSTRDSRMDGFEDRVLCSHGPPKARTHSLPLCFNCYAHYSFLDLRSTRQGNPGPPRNQLLGTVQSKWGQALTKARLRSWPAKQSN